MEENPKTSSSEQGVEEGADEELGSGRREASSQETAEGGALDDDELRRAQEGTGYGASGTERDDA